MTTNQFTSSKYRWLFAFCGLTALLTAVEWAVAHSLTFTRKPDLLSLGITLDLVLGIPLAYYLLVVRRAKLGRATLLAVVMGSGLLAGIILPAAQHRYMGYWERVMALVEVGVLLLVAAKGRTAVGHFRELQRRTPDFITNLYLSLAPIVGNDRLASLLVSEIGVFRYSLFGVMGGIEKTENQRAFTTHCESGQIGAVSALLAVGVIETGLVHLLMARWSPAVAWIATAVSLYGMLFFIADTVALGKRPILIDGETVRVRLGLRWQGSFIVNVISRVTAIAEAPAKHSETLNGCFITAPNVLLTFHQPIRFFGPYGSQRAVRQIALFIDDRDAFIRTLTPYLPTCS